VPDVFKGPYSEHDFSALEKLKTLNLGYNDLHTLDADLFEHIPNIEELVLCSNAFHVIDRLSETAISGLSSLKVYELVLLLISKEP